MNAVASSAKEFATGVRGFWRGVRWISQRPSLMTLLAVPWVLAALAFAAGIWTFWTKGDAWATSILMGWFTSWGDGWFWESAFVILKAVVWLTVLLLCLVSAAVVLGVVASPIYEMISVCIETEVLGPQTYHVPRGRMLRVLGGELLKALVILFIPLILLLLPGVNLFAGFVAAFLIGWDFYDYPLARRGWSFSERWRFVKSEFWTVFGFGLWLTIPIVQIVLVPMAIAGGTLLNIEALRRRGLVATMGYPE